MSIRLKRGDASKSNPILQNGEPGWDTVTKVLKVGDGVTPWSLLPEVGVRFELPEYLQESELDDKIQSFVSLGEPNGAGSLDSQGRQPEEEVPFRLTRDRLSSDYVSIRTSDGQNLPVGTVVVISLDKTFDQIMKRPVADIADITFESGEPA